MYFIAIDMSNASTQLYKHAHISNMVCMLQSSFQNIIFPLTTKLILLSHKIWQEFNIMAQTFYL